MTTTSFLSFNVGPLGHPTGYLSFLRPIDDQLSDVVNVKDFGALGNYNEAAGTGANDTAAIQSALDACFGAPQGVQPVTSTFNAHLNYANRPLFFPAGTYLITDTLYVECVRGSWIIGEGSGTTRLLYNGAFPNVKPAYGNDKTSLFFTNGFNYSRIEGITFEIKSGHNAPADKTVCFNWNWQVPGGPVVNTTYLLCIDVGWKGGTYGMASADVGPAGVWGNECDQGAYFNCWADNCYYGIFHGAQNAIDCGWYGGSIRNCNQAGAVGMKFFTPIHVIQGCEFDWNDLDIEVQSPINLINCKSNSGWFFKALGRLAAVQGCTHNAAHVSSLSATAIFVGTVNTTESVAIDYCTTNATLIQGPGMVSIKRAKVPSDDFSGLGASFSGKILEFDMPSMPFAKLPPVDVFAAGVTVSITDSPSASQFGNVTAGGSSNKVMLNCSGGTANGSITFSAQPADGSTVTLSNARVFTFQNARVTGAAKQFAGSGGTNGTGTLTLVGGTGTAATLNATVAGGILTTVSSVATGGSYTVKPPAPCPVTWSLGGLTGATVFISGPDGNQGAGVDAFSGVFREDTLAKAIDNLAALINQDSISNHITAVTSGGNTVKFKAVFQGTAANAYDLVAGTSPASHGTATPSGGKMTGGAAPVWKVTGV